MSGDHVMRNVVIATAENISIPKGDGPGNTKIEDTFVSVNGTQLAYRNKSPEVYIKYLFDRSQEAYMRNYDDRFQYCNPDLQWCGVHQRVAEKSRLHKRGGRDISTKYALYDPKCNMCIDPKTPSQNGDRWGILDTFFLIDHLVPLTEKEPIAVARKNFDIAKEKYDAPKLKPAGEDDYSEEFAYRSAKLVYRIVATNITDQRQSIIRGHFEGNATQDGAYDNLEDDDVLDMMRPIVQAYDSEFAVGDISLNQKACSVHEGNIQGEPAIGHSIHILSKKRYKACGVCVAPRHQSKAQAEADEYNLRMQGKTHTGPSSGY
jgi:hypothetical protein